MAEEKQAVRDEKRCLVCQATSQERILLSAVQQDRIVWVCVRCLPTLIHGAH